MLLKLPKAIWIPAVSVIAVTSAFGYWSSRPRPPIPLLQGASPVETRLETDRLGLDYVRRIYVYRFKKDYFEVMQRGAVELGKVPGWGLDGGGEGPDWVEFQKGDESVEFVSDLPWDYYSKANGVMWSPAGQTGKGMTVFYTRPASGLESMLYELRTMVFGKPKP